MCVADSRPYPALFFGRCEKGVMSLVNVRNCIRFYQTAEELNASTLMNYCAEIIASHWVSIAWMVFSQRIVSLRFKLVAVLASEAVRTRCCRLNTEMWSQRGDALAAA